MTQPSLTSSAASDAPLPRSLSLQHLTLSAAKDENDYGNSQGYYTGYDLGSNYLRSPNSYFENQQQSLWCWIAVASTLGNYYAGGYRYSQAYLYNYMMRTSCNVPPHTQAPGSTCNRSGDASLSMNRIGIYASKADGSPGIPNLLEELMNNRPFVVVLEMAYPSTGVEYLHCVVIDAGFMYNKFSYWNVCDPIDGVNMVRIDTFPQGYPSNFGGSAWYFTFLSKSPS